MKLSKTSVQAALALAHLASQPPGQPIQARCVAAYLGIPADSALKILQVLARHDLIQSYLGRSGGYCLHGTAQGITLLQIVEAIEGPINGQLRGVESPESLAPGMAVLRQVCAEAAEGLRRALSRITVADLARGTPAETTAIGA